MAEMPQELKDILLDFEMVGASDRPMYLIDYSDRFHAVPERIVQRPFPEEHHVKECESDAYVFFEPREDGTLNFYFAVENPQGVSARAFSKILQDALSGKSSAEIEAVPDKIVMDLFGSGISMGKGLGLQGILRMVKYFAREHGR
ncbi:MAG: SufE family protein [Anaerolineae bacterium]|nr:SufE family protein [Anaerolineae bacterium]